MDKPVKGFHSTQQFAVVSAADQDLCVVLDGLCQNGKRPNLEFFSFALRQLLGGHFGLRSGRHSFQKNRFNKLTQGANKERFVEMPKKRLLQNAKEQKRFLLRNQKRSSCLLFFLSKFCPVCLSWITVRRY